MENLSNKDLEIESLLTNLDDPNSSDVDFIDDECEDDNEEVYWDSVPGFQRHLFDNLCQNESSNVPSATFDELFEFGQEETAIADGEIAPEEGVDDVVEEGDDFPVDEVPEDGTIEDTLSTNSDENLSTRSACRFDPTNPVPSTSNDQNIESIICITVPSADCFARPNDLHLNPSSHNRKQAVKQKQDNALPSKASPPKKQKKTAPVQKPKPAKKQTQYPKWYKKDNDFVGKFPNFTGNVVFNFQDPANVNSPLKYFLSLFSEDLIDIIARETTRYASQNEEPEFSTSSEEIKIFLAINIIMTYIRYPNYRMYWSSMPSFRMDFIADSMPLKRFEKIKRFIHFIDNETIPNDNKDIFIKLKPVIEVLNKTFQDVMSPPEYVAVDEAIIPFKGRSRAKQYLKKKPKKWGFKAWVMAASNGYVCKFELYQGKRDESTSELGVIGDTVMRMCSGIHGMNHKLFLDNLFVSYRLLKSLAANDIHVVGVIRSDRLYGANTILENTKEFQKKERGTMNVATSEDNITIVQWKDTGVVYVASSFAGIEPISEVRRWDKETKTAVTVQRPHCVSIYNKFMGGVDLSDRMVAHYPHALKSKRFYLRIFFYLLNVSLVNSWILLKEKTNQRMSFLDFKANVANALIQVTKKRKVGRPPSITPPTKKRARPGVIVDVRHDGLNHYPSKSNPGRCREATCKRRTRFKCTKCNVPICPECMEKFHTK